MITKLDKFKQKLLKEDISLSSNEENVWTELHGQIHSMLESYNKELYYNTDGISDGDFKGLTNDLVMLFNSLKVNENIDTNNFKLSFRPLNTSNYESLIDPEFYDENSEEYQVMTEMLLNKNDLIYARTTSKNGYSWVIIYDPIGKNAFYDGVQLDKDGNTVKYSEDYFVHTNVFNTQNAISILKDKDPNILFENHLLSINSLNPTKDQMFKKSSFTPTFQNIIYNTLRNLLPAGYKIDIKKFGDKNTISIKDMSDKRYAFRVEDGTSIAKIMKAIKTKFNLNEKISEEKIIEIDSALEVLRKLY